MPAQLLIAKNQSSDSARTMPTSVIYEEGLPRMNSTCAEILPLHFSTAFNGSVAQNGKTLELRNIDCRGLSTIWYGVAFF